MTHPLTPREKDADRLCDKVQAEYPNILTALASGSGDHAELARLAEAAQSATSIEEGSRYGEYAAIADVVGRERTDFWFRANPATVLALLAEITALRAEVSQANANGASHWSRATEAERKLAEADQVIRDIAKTPYTGADWPRSRAATYIASKEAERG